MVFISEFVPEEDKARFNDTTLWNRPGSGGKSMELYRWMIDRKRDFFVIKMGGGGPGIAPVYALSIANGVIKYQGGARSTPIEGDKANGYLSEWYIFNVQIPADLENQRDEILQLIEEAHKAAGNSVFDSSNIKAVNVYFSNPPQDMYIF